MSRVRNLVDYQSQTADLDGDATRDLNISGTVTAGAVASANVPDVNLTIAPEVLEIQVDAPDAGQDTMWKWTWEQSTLPYARRTITNSAELNVPLYKEGTYVVNNFAAYDIHGSMTQTHSLYLKWIKSAGTDNLVSWATSAGPISDTHASINGGAATDVQRITVNVPTTITPPSLTNPSVAYTVTNTASGSYTFSGSASGNNPNLGPFYRGGTYTINITASGHPFYFTTDNGTNFSAGTYFGEYTSGVTGSRNDTGSVTFTVPAGAPDTLYYQCGNHSAMRGEITIKDLAVETNINGNYVVYFQHTQEGHATPVELRPIPSLVNQMCLVYDNASGKFVPQDLATYVENTPSFENKIREVAGTAELVVADGSAVIAKVNVYADSTYLPLTGNNAGDQAFATDTDILYIWDGSAWQQAGAANSDDLTEGSTNLFFTDARADARISAATTTDLSEGTNLYYTDARADARAQLKVDALVDTAPGTLDTLNELAAALGDDPNFATTVTNSIATKLPLAGGTMTGGLDINSTARVLANNTLFFMNTNNSASSYIKNTLGAGTADLRLGVMGGDKLTILSNGNVGIGTTSPASRLDVKGAFRITRDVDAGHASEGNWVFNISHEDAARYGSLYLIPSVSTAEIDLASKVRIKNNGNVGIGTTSPGEKLEVNGVLQIRRDGDHPALRFAEINSGITTTRGYIASGDWAVNGGAIDDFGISGSVTGDLLLATNAGTERLRIQNSTGNVGIGTTSPQGKLHVNGGPTLLGVSDDWHQSTNSPVGTTLIRGGWRSTAINNDTTALKIYNAAGGSNKTANNYNNGIGFMHLDPENYSGYTGQHAWIGLRIFDTPAQERSALVFATNNNTASGSHPTERLTINPNGYVGIGNSSPGYHIDARGGSSTGDGMRVKTGDNGYDGLIVSSSAVLKCYPAAGQSVSLQAYNSGGSTKTGVKVTGFDTPAGEISTKLEFVTEMLGHNVYDGNEYGTSNDQYVDLEDWSPADFRILEIFGTANPNSGGSSAYADPVHMYVYCGSGWNGAELTYYVYGKSIAPLARDMYNSGSGSSANVAEVWWYNNTTTAQQDAATYGTASGYHLRLKFPNTNTSSTQINLKVIKRA